MYCLFCVVLCIVCVYMCTVLLPPGGYPIAVKYIIPYQVCENGRWKSRTSVTRVSASYISARVGYAVKPHHILK